MKNHLQTTKNTPVINNSGHEKGRGAAEQAQQKPVSLPPLRVLRGFLFFLPGLAKNLNCGYNRVCGGDVGSTGTVEPCGRVPGAASPLSGGKQLNGNSFEYALAA